MATNKITDSMSVDGQLHCNSFVCDTASVTAAMIATNAAIARTQLAQDTLKEYNIPLTSFRVHDAIGTLLGSSANDDLGIDSGTFGTTPVHLTAGNLGSAGATTRYARAVWQMPAEYDDNETAQIRLTAVMQTAVADVSCTADVELYTSDDDLTASADLISTAATSINSATAADYDFTISAGSLAATDWFDFRIAIACNDAATGTVEPTIIACKLLCDVRG